MRRNLIASFRRWISVSDGQRGGCVTRMTKRIMDGYWSDGIWKTKPARARIDTCRTLVMFHLPNDQQRRIIDKVSFRWMRVLDLHNWNNLWICKTGSGLITGSWQSLHTGRLTEQVFHAFQENHVMIIRSTRSRWFHLASWAHFSIRLRP